MMGWFFVIALLLIGFGGGTLGEYLHLRQLTKRELQTQRLRVMTLGAKTPLPEARDAKLFVGSAVMSCDYCRATFSLWGKLFGGRLPAYEALLERGRREAILRLKEEAIAWGARSVVNLRLETINLNDQVGDRGLPILEIIAYGTGVR